MKKKIVRFIFLFLAVGMFLNCAAQQGKHGAKIVTASNTIVNEYTSLTASVIAGTTTIPVSSSFLNSNSRFPQPLAAGDLIMIYQVQGVSINGFASGTIGLPNDNTWGEITSYNNTGNYEFAEVHSVPNSTFITLSCGITKNYTVQSSPVSKTIIVRVPRYTSLTVNAGGVLTCDDWDGTVGGILAVEVQGNTVVNAGGTIDATGRGFRGGIADNVSTFGINNQASTDASFGGEKGEGVAGYQGFYDFYGGRYGVGAAANGGGGGGAHNGGGGGGANGFNANSITPFWYYGLGIPDLSGTNYTTAWNLDNTMIPTLNTINSSGGGRGGYSFSSSNQNAITTAPNSASWGGDNRSKFACGLGGRPLDYAAGKLFFGGGGGAGDGNSGATGSGGDGGGIIYLQLYGTLSGSGTIQANGNNGVNAQGGSGFPTGIDGAGGGGGGGVVVLNAVGTIDNTLAINTNGGNGGNQVVFPATTNEAEGPGGGGGGGYIAVSNGTPVRNSNGGNNGTSNSNSLTEFVPNGATKGCPGNTIGAITNFTINAANVNSCAGSSATLTASTSGTLPAGGVTFVWYNTLVGGNQIGTGASFTTGILNNDTVFYVTTCPGTYRIPVAVTVSEPALAVTNISQILPVTNLAIFTGNCIDLIARLNPTGASPVNGNTTAKVWIESSQPASFVKRHYEITPAANASTATGMVTLYFTQAEFDAYNLVNTIKLPANGTDAVGVANLRIEKYSGISNDGSGLPGSYSGPSVLIDPNDTNISWNATQGRWEISFDVTGFSGFFAKTITGTLPVKWLLITSKLNTQKQAIIYWQVQETNVAKYEIEKSTDGISFSSIGTVSGKGDGTNSYSFTDATILNNTGYYRIKQTEKDSRVFYSAIIRLSESIEQKIIIYPNPVLQGNTIQVSVGNRCVTGWQLINGIGQVIAENKKLNAQSNFSINLPAAIGIGIYQLKLNTDLGISVEKIIIK